MVIERRHVDDLLIPDIWVLILNSKIKEKRMESTSPRPTPQRPFRNYSPRFRNLFLHFLGHVKVFGIRVVSCILYSHLFLPFS